MPSICKNFYPCPTLAYPCRAVTRGSASFKSYRNIAAPPEVCLQNKTIFIVLSSRTLSLHSSVISHIISMMLVLSLVFFVSVYILIGACALADSDPSYRNPSLAEKLTTRQAAGSVPASEFVRRAFQGCKCWRDLRSIDLTVTFCQQLLSLETGSILMEVKFPTIAEGFNMSTVRVESYGELAPLIDKMRISNNTALY